MALMCLCILTVPQSQHLSTCLILHLWKHFRTFVAIHFSQRVKAFKGLHEWRKRLPCILHHQPTHPPFHKKMVFTRHLLGILEQTSF